LNKELPEKKQVFLGRTVVATTPPETTQVYPTKTGLADSGGTKLETF
jgi:hypothetical protein